LYRKALKQATRGSKVVVWANSLCRSLSEVTSQQRHSWDRDRGRGRCCRAGGQIAGGGKTNTLSEKFRFSELQKLLNYWDK